MSTSQQKQSDWQVFKRLMLLFKPYRGWMMLGIFLSLITAVANVGLLALSGWFISMMAIAGVAGITEVNYFTPSASIRGLAIVRTASRYIERVVSHEITFRLIAALRQWFYNKLEPLAPAVLQDYKQGDILSRISADMDTLEHVYLRIISPMVVAIVALAFYLLFLSRYDPQLMFAELVLLVLAGLVTPIIINKLAQKSARRLNQTASELRSAAIDSVQGMGEILIYDARDSQIKHTQALSTRLIKDQKTQAKLSGFSQAFVGLCANLTMLAMLIISIPLIHNGTLGAAHLAMLALFAVASFEVILPLPLAFQLLPATLSAGRRLFEIVDARPQVTEPVTASPTPESFDIRFEQVNFSYPSQSQAQQTPAISNLSFTLKTGDKLAIVGPSGSGKSSIVQLLARFWTLKGKDSGSIRFGGYDINRYHSDDLRRYFSIVSQHTILFNNTIKNNLLLANPKASNEMLDKVCRITLLEDFIKAQPNGYDTWVGETGLQLSGGQAKRLSIARALLKDAPVLILDEPGEGLDAETEKAVLNNVFAYYTKRNHASILLITHKKAGLDLVDTVLDM